MADRRETLTVVRGGIDRLRTRGGAPRDHLYDLLNGYVTTEKTVVVRPGTFRDAELPVADTTGRPLTHGLVSANGTLNVFTAEEFSEALPAGYTKFVINHPKGPTDENGAPIRIKRIHFAQLFMGFLYVSAEFDTGDTYHFWLQTGAAWAAEKAYRVGDVVAPSVPNGFAYQATRVTAAAPQWAAGVPRAVGAIVEPTVFNGFFYTAVEVLGTNPVSGPVEPVWPTVEGAQVFDETEAAFDGLVNATEQPDPTITPPPETQCRYVSRGGLVCEDI